MNCKRALKRLAATFTLAAALSFEAPPAQAQATPQFQNTQFSQIITTDRERDIVFDAYESLPASWKRVLEQSKQAQDFAGLQGKDLYTRLDSPRRVALMNFFAKAEATQLPDQSNVLAHIQEIDALYQNNILVTVDAQLDSLLKRSDEEGVVFYRCPRIFNILHDAAAPGYKKVDSYKTRDARGNLEVTVSQKDNSWKAEVDIDLAQPGLRHFFGEVVPHMVTGGVTDPYHVEPLLARQKIDTRYKITKGPEL